MEEMVMAYLRAPGGRAPGEAAAGGAAPGAEAVFAGLTPAGPALVQPADPTEVIR